MHALVDSALIPVEAQVSYASADGSGSGGWQVKQKLGAIDPETLNGLVRRMATRLEPTFVMPEYPTEDLPRRMLIASVGADAEKTAVWHSYPAGRDGSSRPGNVFTHCAVLASSQVRPSLLWRSNDWRTPFGAAEVEAAMLPEVSGLGTVPGMAELTTFLFDPEWWRLGTLAVILDAVDAALRNGPAVVLQVADCDEAAAWLKAISLCTDAVTSQLFHTSTYERARDFAAWRSLGLHVVGVPRTDADELIRTPGVVIIDTAEAAMLGDLGGDPHRTARGDEVEVTAWSQLVLETCAGAAELLQLAEEADVIRGKLPAAKWEPAWPLALIAWRNAGPNLIAAAVLSRSTPKEIGSVPEYYAIAAGAVDHLLGPDLDSRVSAFEAMERGNPGLVPLLALGEVVRGAVADPAWLGTVARAPSVPPGWAPELTQELHDSVLEGLERHLEAPIFGAEQVRAAVRAIDLLAAVGWNQAALEGRMNLLADRVAELCQGPNPELAATLAGAGAAKGYVRESLQSLCNRSSSLGRRMACDGPDLDAEAVPIDTLEVLGCLGADLLLDESLVEPSPLNPLLARAARARLSQDGPPDRVFARAAALALRADLEQHSIFRLPVIAVALDPADLADLLDRFGAAVPDGVVLRTAAAVSRESLTSLVSNLDQLAHPAWQAVDGLLQLQEPLDRSTPFDAWLNRAYTLDQLTSSTAPDLQLPAGVAERKQAIIVAALLAGFPMPRPSEHATLAEMSDLVVLAEQLVGRSCFTTGSAVLDGVAHHTAGSPLHRRPAAWADWQGPAELFDRLIGAAAKAAGVTISAEEISAWVAAHQEAPGLELERETMNVLRKYLKAWVGAHDLNPSRNWMGIRQKRSDKENAE